MNWKIGVKFICSQSANEDTFLIKSKQHDCFTGLSYSSDWVRRSSWGPTNPGPHWIPVYTFIKVIRKKTISRYSRFGGL